MEIDYQKLPVFKLKKLAAENDGNAQCELGLRYRDGRGVLEDIELAEQFLRQAAENSVPAAQLALAEIVEIYDESEATVWRSRATCGGQASSPATSGADRESSGVLAGEDACAPYENLAESVPAKPRSRRKSIFWLFIITLILLAILAGTLFLLFHGNGNF